MIDKLSHAYLKTLYQSLSLSQLLFAWAIVLCVASAIRFSWLEYKSLCIGDVNRKVFIFSLRAIRSLLMACTLGLLHVVLFCE